MSAVAHRADQHPVLDRVDLVLDRLQHRHVVVDDEVEDRVQDEVLALGEAGRAALPVLAHRRVGGRGAVPDADDVALADEEVRLAEGTRPSISCAVRATMKSASPYCSSFGRWWACSASSIARSCSLNSRCTRRSSSRSGSSRPIQTTWPSLRRPFRRLLDRDVGDPPPAVDAGGDDAGLGGSSAVAKLRECSMPSPDTPGAVHPPVNIARFPARRIRPGTRPIAAAGSGLSRRRPGHALLHPNAERGRPCARCGSRRSGSRSPPSRCRRPTPARARCCCASTPAGSTSPTR